MKEVRQENAVQFLPGLSTWSLRPWVKRNGPFFLPTMMSGSLSPLKSVAITYVPMSEASLPRCGRTFAWPLAGRFNLNQ